MLNPFLYLFLLVIHPLQSVKAPQKQQGTIIQTKVRASIATAGMDELPVKTNKGMGLALLAGVMLLG